MRVRFYFCALGHTHHRQRRARLCVDGSCAFVTEAFTASDLDGIASNSSILDTKTCRYGRRVLYSCLPEA